MWMIQSPYKNEGDLITSYKDSENSLMVGHMNTPVIFISKDETLMLHIGMWSNDIQHTIHSCWCEQ
jgi:hypothetical protein